MKAKIDDKKAKYAKDRRLSDVNWKEKVNKDRHERRHKQREDPAFRAKEYEYEKKLMETNPVFREKRLKAAVERNRRRLATDQRFKLLARLRGRFRDLFRSGFTKKNNSFTTGYRKLNGR